MTKLFPNWHWSCLESKWILKKKVRNFNQQLLTMRYKIPPTSRSMIDLTIEFYIAMLPPSMAMFIKTDEKVRLNENF